MKKLLSFIVCLLMCAMPMMADQKLNSVPASEEKDYALCVKDFMSLSNMKHTFESTLAASYMQMKDNLHLSEQDCQELAKGMTEWIYDDIVELAIPIYKKYYTLEDLQQLCAFMRTPTGQKFAKYSAEVSTEMMGNMAGLQNKMQEFVVRFLEKKK